MTEIAEEELLHTATVTPLRVVGTCRDCPFTASLGSQARIHVMSAGHVVTMTKHYKIEPDEEV
jgi:hypothetical protein